MQPQTHEWMFYEVMWRIQGRGCPLPLPWWVQQYFRRWTDAFDAGLFNTREGAFASNANFRYWNMIGVKDAPQECLVGQAGEIEPVYDEYALSFFLFDPTTRQFDFPSSWLRRRLDVMPLRQRLENGYLPVVITTWQSRFGCEVRGDSVCHNCWSRTEDGRVGAFPTAAHADHPRLAALRPRGVTCRADRLPAP